MVKVALFIENGSEELEFIAPLDILRRGGVEVDLISANDNKNITTSHNVNIVADKTIAEIENILDYDGIIIPGGLPGSEYLRDNNKIITFYQDMYKNKKLVAAICAAPIVLDKAAIINDKEITCYPGFEKNLNIKKYNSEAGVVVDENVITAQGPALAMNFGYTILSYLKDTETSKKVSDAMLIPVLKNSL